MDVEPDAWYLNMLTKRNNRRLIDITAEKSALATKNETRKELASGNEHTKK